MNKYIFYYKYILFSSGFMDNSHIQLKEFIRAVLLCNLQAPLQIMYVSTVGFRDFDVLFK